MKSTLKKCTCIGHAFVDKAQCTQSSVDKLSGFLFFFQLVLDWFVQICFALKYIHGLHIVHRGIIIIIIDNRGLNARRCLTPLLLSLPTAAYLGQRGLTPAGLPHTTA